MSGIRVTFDVPEYVKRAVNIIASREGITLGEALTLCVEQAAPDAVEEAKSAIAAGKPTASRKGRPPKPKGG